MTEVSEERFNSIAKVIPLDADDGEECDIGR